MIYVVSCYFSISTTYKKTKLVPYSAQPYVKPFVVPLRPCRRLVPYGPGPISLSSIRKEETLPQSPLRSPVDLPPTAAHAAVENRVARPPQIPAPPSRPGPISSSWLAPPLSHLLPAPQTSGARGDEVIALAYLSFPKASRRDHAPPPSSEASR
jgi:hypothetical protein